MNLPLRELQMSQQSEYNEIEDYFLNITLDQQTGCHLWEGSVSPNGYGVCNMFGRTQSTHRYAWEQEHGDIPEGMIILHSCDVRNCVNVEHMSLGTKKENSQDMVAKGRFCLNPKPARKIELEERVLMAQMYAVGDTWYRIGLTLGRSQQQVKTHVERHLGIT